MTTLTKKDEAESVGPSGAPAAQSLDVTGVLKYGRDRVARGWTRWFLAVNVAGECTTPHGKTAVAWCMIGALPDGYYKTDATAFLHTAIGGQGSFADWNSAPERTQADAVAAYDKAIALASAASAYEGGP